MRRRLPSGKRTIVEMGFLKALEAATATVGADNMIEPKAAKELLDANSDALLLDVQDPGSDSIPGAYNASLGTLVFKASQDLADFKGEPAERPLSTPHHTTCAARRRCITRRRWISCART